MLAFLMKTKKQKPRQDSGTDMQDTERKRKTKHFRFYRASGLSAAIFHSLVPPRRTKGSRDAPSTTVSGTGTLAGRVARPLWALCETTALWW